MVRWIKRLSLFTIVSAVVAGAFMSWTQTKAQIIASKPVHLSPIALVGSPDGKQLYVAGRTGRQIVVCSTDTDKVIRKIPLMVEPNDLAISPDGKQLYVTTDSPAGRVMVISTAPGGKIREIKTNHVTAGPSVTPDGKTLFFCNRFRNEVTAVDTKTLKVLATMKATREPIATAVSADGTKLIVVNHLPSQPLSGAYVAASVNIFNAKTFKLIKTVGLPNGSNGSKSVAISKDGKYAYVPHVLARYQLPTNMLARGWMNSAALSIIDLEKNKLFATVPLDSVDKGAANPWTVCLTPDQKQIVVSLAGTHELEVIDRDAMHRKLAKRSKTKKVGRYDKKLENTSEDLSLWYSQARSRQRFRASRAYNHW